MARSTSVFVLLITVALVLSIRSTLATEGPAPGAISPTAQSPTAASVANGFSGTWETWYKKLKGYLGFDPSKPNNYSKKKAPAPGHAPAGAPISA